MIICAQCEGEIDTTEEYDDEIVLCSYDCLIEFCLERGLVLDDIPEVH